MPQLIRHIDKIGRDKRRTVLWVTFHRPRRPGEAGVPPIDMEDFDHRKMAIREQVIQWLEEHRIAWEPCGRFANENYMAPYLGDIYVDIPMDESNTDYCAMREFMELPDGSMRHAEASWCYLPLESAMKNAHHDEPGFWENWAANF